MDGISRDPEPVKIAPQPGPQEQFFTTNADIIIYGGAAGGGKTWALLYEFLRRYYVKNHYGIIFRRNTNQIRTPGGLLDESRKLYPMAGGTLNNTTLEWRWLQHNSRIKFTHLLREETKYDHQGGQYAYVGWDELTHFTRTQFFYLLSRMRSMTGVTPYMRATCNPDADSWVAEFIDWWIDQETGYPIPDRAGRVRAFFIQNDEVVWGDSRQELIEKYAPARFHAHPDHPENPIRPKTFTFIPAKVTDNRRLMEVDPDYVSNLMAQSSVEQERLLHGNWKIKPQAGQYFQRYFFEVVDAPPARAVRVRVWDQAGTAPSETNPDPDWTVGVLMSRDADGVIYIEDVIRFRENAHAVFPAIKRTAQQDGRGVQIGLYQDPGQAGKYQAQQQTRALPGFAVHVLPATKSKEAMASPFSAQARAGNVRVVRGKWNEDFFRELENFPIGAHDDQVDAASGAFKILTEYSRPAVSVSGAFRG